MHRCGVLLSVNVHPTGPPLLFIVRNLDDLQGTTFNRTMTLSRPLSTHSHTANDITDAGLISLIIYHGQQSVIQAFITW